MRGDNASSQKNILFMLFMPFIFIYLEIIIRLQLGMNNDYLIIVVLFSLCYGFFLEFLLNLLGGKAFRVANFVSVFIICLLYSAELLAKLILQSFYQLSILGIAAGNHLTDYSDLIYSTIKGNLVILILMWLPLILSVIFRKKLFGAVVGNGDATSNSYTSSRDDVFSDTSKYSEPVRLRIFKKISDVLEKKILAVQCLLLSSIFLLSASVCVNFAWSGDIVPKQLYRTNTMIDDQVEQLGLATMIKLDILYKFFQPNEVYNPVGSSIGFVQPPEKNPEPTVPEKVETPQILNIDLQSLASSSDKRVAWLSSYFQNTAPTMTNDYTGIFKGYNVITIVAEGMSGYGISEKYTPTLYKLSTEGYNFKNYYTALHFTSTSNGECQTLLGLYPKAAAPITMSRTGERRTNTYFSLSRQLEKLGYSNYGYHNNVDMYNRNASHKNLGYVWKYCGRGLNYEKKSNGDLIWPQRDKYMIDNTIGEYVNSSEPFNTYYLTISGHAPYSWNYATSQYRSLFEDSPYSNETNAYIATLVEVDRAVESLIEGLRNAWQLEKTIIVLTPDHIPYNKINILQELSGQSFYKSDSLSSINESEINFDVYKSSLIIWTPNAKHTVVDKVCCQVDILPTLSNLLGLKYDSRMLAGRDIFSTQEGLVVFSSGSWKTDRGLYHRHTQTFTPSAGSQSMSAEETESYVSQMKVLVSNRLSMTERIVESNFYNYIDSHLLPDADADAGSTDAGDTGEGSGG